MQRSTRSRPVSQGGSFGTSPRRSRVHPPIFYQNFHRRNHQPFGKLIGDNAALVIPIRSILVDRIPARELTSSLATSTCPCSLAPIWVDFPPGAAQRSSTQSPGWGVQHLNRRHRCRFLDVIKTGIIVGIFPRPHRIVNIKPFLTPVHTLVLNGNLLASSAGDSFRLFVRMPLLSGWS